MPDIQHNPLPEAEAQAAFTRKAQALGLGAPALAFASICMDGQPYTNRYWARPRDEIFPRGVDAVESRLEQMGTMWAKQGVLEFVDGEGRYHVARDVEANRAALKNAGFKDSGQYRAFFCDGVHPSAGNAKRFKELLHAPQDLHEQLAQSVRHFDVAAVDATLNAGARVRSAKGYGGDALIFDILTSANPARDTIATRLLPESVDARNDSGQTLLHVLLASSTDATFLIAAALKAGVDPFARDDKGVPAFLMLNSAKPSGREELQCIEKGMLEKLRNAHDKALMRAQFDYMYEVMQSGNTADTYKTIAKLKEIWKLAQLFSPDDTGKLPGQVKTFLAPMIGPRPEKFKALFNAYDMSELDRENELSREFTAHIVLPLALMAYAKQQGIALDDALLFGCDPYRKEMMDILLPAVKAELFKGRSIDKIIGFNEGWNNDRRAAFPDTLQPLKAKGEWHSITGKKQHALSGGLTLHVLTDDRELGVYGSEMNNCVGRGAYAALCLDGDAHLFALRSADNSRTLAMMDGKCRGECFTIKQNVGHSNSPPSAEAKMAEEWLLQQIATGAIKLNGQRGETEESKRRNPRPKLLRTVGFEITPENVDAAFAEICHNPWRKVHVYDAQKVAFEHDSHQPGLISGTYNLPQPFVNDKGHLVTSAAYSNIPAEVWFEASGMQEKTLPLITPLVEAALARQSAATRSWEARTTGRAGAAMAK